MDFLKVLLFYLNNMMFKKYLKKYSKAVIGDSFLMVYRLKMSSDSYGLFHTSMHLLSINPEEYAPSLTELDLLLTNILGISVCKWKFKD